MADRLQALEVARAENLNPGPAAPEAFGPKGANDLFKSMMGSGGGSKISHALAAEVRSSAGRLGRGGGASPRDGNGGDH